jgi:hypothetical protein
MNRSSVGNIHSPRNERQRLPSLDGSTDSINVHNITKIFLRKTTVVLF